MAGSNARAQQSTTAALETKDRSEALAGMHLTRILRAYILQMISGACWVWLNVCVCVGWVCVGMCVRDLLCVYMALEQCASTGQWQGVFLVCA